MTTVRPTRAPEIRSSVAPLAAVGTGATLVLDCVAVETVKVDSLLDTLERALDCEAEMLDSPDEAAAVIEEAAEDAAALIEEAVELAPAASEDDTEARDEAAELAPDAREAVALETAAEMEAVLIGATIVTEDPEMTVVRVVDPVVAALKGDSTALDCELCSDDSAELRTVRALDVPAGAAEVGVVASVIVAVLEAADDPPTITTPAVFVAVRDSKAELRTVKALVVPGFVGVDSMGVTVVTGLIVTTGSTMLTPVVDNDSVIVVVATMVGWPVQTGRVTLVM